MGARRGIGVLMVATMVVATCLGPFLDGSPKLRNSYRGLSVDKSNCIINILRF